MQDVAQQGEREVAAGGVAADEDVAGGEAEGAEDVVEELGGLGELPRVGGEGGDVVVEDEGGEAVVAATSGSVVVQVVDEGVEKDEVLGGGGDGVAAACFLVSFMSMWRFFIFFLSCGWDGRGGEGKGGGEKGGTYRGRISTLSRRPWSRPSRRLCRP